MELEGQLNPALSLPEVLQFLSMGKMTGALVIDHGSYSVTLTLRHGKLVNSSSLGRPRRLGQMLVNRGLIDRTDLETALELQKDRDPQPLLGRVLVERGLISMEQLKQAIRLQLEEEMWDLFAMPEGSFKFEHGAPVEDADVIVEMEIEPLILEGTRRLDEWARIIRNIPGDHAVPAIRPLADASDRELMTFSDNEWRVLSLVNGFYNVGSISARTGIGRFETYRILNSFLASGYVTISGDAESSVPTASRDDVAFLRSGQPTNGDKQSSSSSSVGYSSARLLAMLIGKKVDESGNPIDKKEDRTPMSFETPVAFVAGLCNTLIEELLTDPEFYVGPADEALAEQYWKNIVMNYPKADLVTATGNRIDSARFDRYVQKVGLEGHFASCYKDTLEALGRYLKMIFLLAAQRLGMKNAQRLFGNLAKNYSSRSTIRHGEGFRFEEYAGRVYV